MTQESDTGVWARLRDVFARRQSGSLRASLEEALEEHEEDGDTTSLSEGERAMLFNILGYGELRVDDVMVPRVDIVAVEVTTPYGDVLNTIADSAHSRMPLYRETLDNVVGMVHVKDIIRSIAQGKTETGFSLKALQRPVLFVPPSMRLRDLMAKMRQRRTHMAIVVDEYGGTDGLVTIEDVVEKIVGDIEDEHDHEGVEDMLQPLEGGGYDADARIEIDDLESTVGQAFLSDDEKEDIDTLGGLVFSLAERVPDIGEIFPHKSGFQFEVVDADPRRIRRIRLHPPSETNGHDAQHSE